MVEKLQTPSPETNNAGLSLELESDVKKAMIKSEVVEEHENNATTNGGGEETDSESGATTRHQQPGEESEEGEENDDKAEETGDNDDEENDDGSAAEEPSLVQPFSRNSFEDKKEKEGKTSSGNNSGSGSDSSKKMERTEHLSEKGGSSSGSGKEPSQQERAKGENGRIVVHTGTSSESSIKTTSADSSLETPSNFESSSDKGESNNGQPPSNTLPPATRPSDQSPVAVASSSSSPSKRSPSQSNSTNGAGGNGDAGEEVVPRGEAASKRKTPTKAKKAVAPNSGENAPRTANPAKNDTSSSTNNNDKSPDSGPLDIRALPFESGINTECIQLLRQLWNVHEEALEFLGGLHHALCSLRQWLRMEDNEYEESLWEQKRLSSTLQRGSLYQQQQQRRLPPSRKSESDAGCATGETGSELRWVPLQPFIDGLKCISDNVCDIEKQCLTLSVFQSQCKLVLYTKIHHARRQVTHDRLEILHGVNQLVTVATQLLASPSFWLSSESDVVTSCACNVFHLCESYNVCLESTWSNVEASLAAANTSLASTPSDADSGRDEMGTTVTPSKIRILTQVKAANRNDASLLKQSLKPLSATKLLQVIAQRRAVFSAVEFTRITFAAFNESQKEVLEMEKFGQCLEEESLHLSTFEKAFSKRPSILGKAALKEAENGELRLTKGFKHKMYGYFHEVLWSLVGEYSEDLILWSLQTTIPLTLQPAETQIALRQALLQSAHAQASNPTSLLAAFEMIGGALHSFSLMVNWDEKMREAFEITYKVKRPEHVALIIAPEPAQWASEVGTKFGEILSSCISLMESGNTIRNRMSLPLAERQKLAELFGEEEPLGDEAQILFRLEATLNYFRVWTVRRAKVWLNSWAVPQFIACSQRDPALLVQMIKSKEVVLITREVLLKSENIAIRISARNRQMCADDVKTAIQNLHRVPDEVLLSVGIVCRTLSLATLQTYMPDANHWRGSGKGSGLNPDKPSSYVRVFIDRVSEPVFKAAVTLVPPLVQESLGKQVINAMCNAWLHYILQKKIKFSEWGAVQLLRDFVAMRDWIRNETRVESDAKKAILQLEVLKSCEGVAYLLLRNPGDVLGVGKPSRKSRKVAPASGGFVGLGSHESSPSPSEESTAEDAIPPEMYVPNQQMWLQLRLKKTGFSACCNF